MLSIRNSALSRRRSLVSASSAGLRASAFTLVGCDSGDDDQPAAPAATAQAAVDDEERARQLFAAQEIARRDGGDLIGGFQPLILACDHAPEGFGLSQDGAPLFHRARFAA